jgi:hypothetical protein
LYFEMVAGGGPVDPAPYLGVGRCGGATHEATHAPVPVVVAHNAGAEEKVIGARKYYQILLPAGQ